MSKNWSPKDLRGTKHLLAEHRAIKEARIAKNAASGNPCLLPVVVEFETPDDRVGLSVGLEGKDYTVAGEEPGQVAVHGSDYDVEDVESFAPRQDFLKPMDATGGWGKHDPLGFDAESRLVDKMTDAVKAWAGMTSPPPKAADPTVEALVNTYLDNGGEVHTCGAYQTTPDSKIKFKFSSPAWAGGTGIPVELRKKKQLCRVRPKTGSKYWSNAI